jgi:uncharacterized protein
MSGVRNRSTSRPGRPAWPFLIALVAVVVLLAGACTSPQTPAGSATAAASLAPAKLAVPPDTPAGAQLRWLIGAVAHLPVSGEQLQAHFDAAFLTQAGPDELNQTLQPVTGVKLVSIQVSDLNTVAAIVSAGGALPRDQVWLTVDSRGLISGLRIRPVTTGLGVATWADVDAALRSVSPEVRLLVADVSSGSCQPLHSIDPAAAAPLGAAFKLYVLDALGNAVASGKVSWNQPLTVTAPLTSLPAGPYQNKPVLTRRGRMGAWQVRAVRPRCRSSTWARWSAGHRRRRGRLWPGRSRPPAASAASST